MPPEAQVRKIRRAGRLRSVCFMLLPMLGVLAVALRFPELGAAPTALIALGTAVLACAASRTLLPVDGVLRDVSVLLARLEHHRLILEQLALQDPLTGINNRRGGELLLARSGKAQASGWSALSVAVVDVDNLRELNSVGGHAHGDAGLRRIADELAAGLRADDWVARWGGDEFLVVCHCTAMDMVAIMERARTTLASNRGESGSDELEISVGVAQLEAGEPLDAWIRRADEALYAAKKQGRNRVRAAVPS